MKLKKLRLPRTSFINLAAFFACLVGLHCSIAQADPLTLKSIKLSTKVDLGQATLTFDLVPANRSQNVTVQIYVHRMPQNDWQFVESDQAGGSAAVFPLFRGLDNNVVLSAKLPVGTYDAYRLLLFNSTSNDTDLVYDSASDQAKRDATLLFKITTEDVRLSTPHLICASLPNVVPEGDGDTYTVTIPGKLQIPIGYKTPGDGFWVMAKGACGFTQSWVSMDSAVQVISSNEASLAAPVTFKLTGVKAGLWNLQFGVFKSTWGDPLEWVFPGLDFEAGGDSWETKAVRMPPRLEVINKRFMQVWPGSATGLKPYSFYSDTPQATKSVSFVRGGNYGNALCWDLQPQLDTPGYFVLLSDIGCRFVRVLFNPDRYIKEDLYQHAVDQVVENIWQAGLYPLISPQDLPIGDSLAERIDRGESVCRLMATNYRGRSVWIELTNEPKEFSTWAAWKPVAERYTKTIRSIDPNALVVVPLEYYSKDARGAAKDPISNTHVDLYDTHLYVAADNVQGSIGSALKSGLPLLVGEYGGSDPVYLSKLNRVFAGLAPAPLAIAPWAFTVKGQDSLPLVEASSGADISYTATGSAVAKDFNAWMAGRPAE